MPVEIHVKVGPMLVRVIEDHPENAIAKAAFFSEVATKSAGRDVSFTYRTPKGYEFFGLVDNKTGEELKFGQKKEEGRCRLFLREDWQPPYSGGDGYHGDHDAGGYKEEPPDEPPQHGRGGWGGGGSSQRQQPRSSGYSRGGR